MKPTRILIFAKAPVRGFAKTRLIPALGAQGAADLARRLLLHCVDQAVKAHVGTVELCVTPDPDQECWQALALPDVVVWSSQGQGDLGERMARATARTINRGESAILIGTDCPALSALNLLHASQLLQRKDVVMTPTFDGGYALLGLNHYDDSVFHQMQWSVDTVAQETIRRIATLGWTLHQQATSHDIDIPDDLQHVPPNWRAELNTATA